MQLKTLPEQFRCKNIREKDFNVSLIKLESLIEFSGYVKLVSIIKMHSCVLEGLLIFSFNNSYCNFYFAFYFICSQNELKLSLKCHTKHTNVLQVL